MRSTSLIDPIHLSILRIIYHRLHGTKTNWAVTGSLSFALQGVPVTPNDIDLQTDKIGAYALQCLFSEFVIRNVTFSSTDKIRSHFGILLIDGVSVEIMGDIQKRLGDGTWEEPVKLERYKQFVAVEDMQIPVLSLDYEHQAYLTLGRFERAQLLEKGLREKVQIYDDKNHMSR